jgi:hypothetical protein
MVGDEIYMNNTKKTITLTIAAIFIAATLVVGGTFAASSAFAYIKKGPQDNKKGARDNGSGNENGNTVTILKCKNKGSASGFDTTTNQECENLICTHPGPGATCVSENEVTLVTPPVTPPTPPPVKEVCLSAQPATVFDVTTTESNAHPKNTVVCLGKPGENNPQNFPPGAAIIPPGETPITGATVRIDNSVGGECPQGVTAIVDSGNPPGGFNIGDTACITFVSG